MSVSSENAEKLIESVTEFESGPLQPSTDTQPIRWKAPTLFSVKTASNAVDSTKTANPALFNYLEEQLLTGLEERLSPIKNQPLVLLSVLEGNSGKVSSHPDHLRSSSPDHSSVADSEVVQEIEVEETDFDENDEEGQSDDSEQRFLEKSAEMEASKEDKTKKVSRKRKKSEDSSESDDDSEDRERNESTSRKEGTEKKVEGGWRDVFGASIKSTPVGSRIAVPGPTVFDTKRVLKDLKNDSGVYWLNKDGKVCVDDSFFHPDTGFDYTVSSIYPKSKKSLEAYFVGTRFWSEIIKMCYSAPVTTRRSPPIGVILFMENCEWLESSVGESPLEYVRLVNDKAVGNKNVELLPTSARLDGTDPKCPLLQLLSFRYEQFCVQSAMNQSKVFKVMRSIDQSSINMIFETALKSDIWNLFRHYSISDVS